MYLSIMDNNIEFSGILKPNNVIITTLNLHQIRLYSLISAETVS
jgi:hypothetical protein